MYTPGANASVAHSAACRTGTKTVQFDGSGVRYVMRSGVPWISATDLARTLGLSADRSPGPWVRTLPATDRDHIEMTTNAGPQRLTAVSVHGAIRLAGRRRSSPAASRVLAFLQRDVMPLVEDRAADETNSILGRRYVAVLRDIANHLERTGDTLAAFADPPLSPQRR
jgi:hypothetical protein